MFTIKYNKTTDHIDGLSIRTEGTQLNYSLTTCSALSRNGHRMATGKSNEDLTEIMKSFGSRRNACVTCMKAAEAQSD